MHTDVRGPEGAPPVLLLHGWGSSAALMEAAGRPLVETHRVHALDLPGHGRTPAPPRLPDGTAWGVPEYAALVAHYIRVHGLAPLPVVGHSNGGRIALTMATDDTMAALISKMVLVSPSGITPPRSAGYHVRRAYVSILKAPFRLVPDGPLRARGLTWLRTTLYWRLVSSGDYAQASDAMRETFVRTVNHHVDDRLGRVRVPTLLVWGDADTAISRVQMDTLAAGIPDAGLLVLPGAGHYGYLDAYPTYAAAVQSFLVA
ncbi:MAG TPA: alpha/beta hydrolase [Rubricoccaceae bacterium]|jgi:pimeloyl-ACP methyl ester carboxylesterase